MKTAAALVLAAVCAASASNTPVAPGCVVKTPVRVQLFGDSTQEGYDARGLVAQPPPVLLQAYFDGKYGPGAVIVTSRARQGSTARSLVDGSDGRNLPWPQSVAADIVVVNHGINDRRLPLDGYRAALERLAHAPAAVVIFETPHPVLGPDIGPGIVATMRDVAARNGIAVADVFAYVSGLGDWDELLADQVHPSADLYRDISRRVLQPAVDGVVAKMRCAAA